MNIIKVYKSPTEIIWEEYSRFKLGDPKIIKKYKDILIKKILKLIDKNKKIQLDDDDLSLIDKAVFNFNTGNNKELQKKIMLNIAKKYLEKGAEVILIGCTEISLMLKDQKINKIDTMDILINGIIDKISK